MKFRRVAFGGSPGRFGHGGAGRAVPAWTCRAVAQQVMKEVFHEDFSAGCMVRGGDRTAASAASVIALPQPDESFGDAGVNTLFKVSDLVPGPLPAAAWRPGCFGSCSPRQARRLRRVSAPSVVPQGAPGGRNLPKRRCGSGLALRIAAYRSVVSRRSGVEKVIFWQAVAAELATPLLTLPAAIRRKR